MTRIIYINKVKIDSNLPAVNFSLGNACGLAQAGAECYLMVQKNSASFDNEKPLDDLDIQPLDNFHMMVYNSRKRLRIKSNQWFYLMAMKDIKAIHEKRGIHAVISRDPGALPYMAHLKRKHGISVFY